MAKRPTKVVTPEYRFSFMSLDVPGKIDPNDPNEQEKYSLTLVVPKTETTFLETLREAYDNAVANMTDFNKNFEPTPFVRPKGKNQSGLLKDEDIQKETQFPGCYTLQLKTKPEYKPDVLCKELGRKILTPEEIREHLYPGCYGKASFSLFGYSNKAEGISAGLGNVLKTKDGERLGGKVSGLVEFGDELEATDDLL